MFHIRDRLRRALRLDQPSPETQHSNAYRTLAIETPEQSAAEILAEFQALRLQVRVLRAQLRADGCHPAATPSVDELRKILDVLECAARFEAPRYNTFELRSLADAMRGWATWGEA